MDIDTNLKLSFNNLKRRIKKNEGYSQTPYKDQLGYFTIGYGHLIKKLEKNYFKIKYSQKHFEEMFDKDFKKAVKDYQTLFAKKKHNHKEKELLIEMVFQLGAKGVLKFKKFLFFLNKKQKYMTCLEMIDSLWYKQTPKRVDNLIKNYTKK